MSSASRERRKATARAHRERRGRSARERRFLAWASGPRCSTCAYRAGTEASGDAVDVGLTRLRIALLDACEPFYCHDEPPPGVRDPDRAVTRRLCIGHMDAIEARTRSGHYDRHPPDAPEVVAELVAANEAREHAFKAALAEREC